MYEWMPPKNNKKAQRAVLLLFGGAAVLMAFPLLIPALPFRWIPQLLALGLLTASIFLMTRYIAKLYIYRIVDCGGGAYDLTVTEAKAGGKGQITVCRVGLSNIRRCILTTADADSDGNRFASQKRKEHKKFFDYCADLHPDQSIILVVEECGEELVIRLSYDATLLELLASHENADGADEEDT